MRSTPCSAPPVRCVLTQGPSTAEPFASEWFNSARDDRVWIASALFFDFDVQRKRVDAVAAGFLGAVESGVGPL